MDFTHRPAGGKYSQLLGPPKRGESGVARTPESGRKGPVVLRFPALRNSSFTREELTAYLLRASAICSKLGLAFLHSFREVTFRKPTFCDSCSGFVSTMPLYRP